MANSSNKQNVHNLPGLSQRLLELVSVIYSPAAGTPISQAAITAGITLDNGLKPTQKIIRQELASLFEQDWLSNSGTQKTPRYQCNQNIRDDLTRKVIKAGKLPNYAHAIKQHFKQSNFKTYGHWNNTPYGIFGYSCFKEKALKPLSYSLITNNTSMANILGSFSGVVLLMTSGLATCQNKLS